MIDHWWPIFCQIDFPLYCFSCLYIKFIFTGTTNTFRFREEITISKRPLMMKIFFTFKVNNQFRTSLRNQKKKKTWYSILYNGSITYGWKRGPWPFRDYALILVNNRDWTRKFIHLLSENKQKQIASCSHDPVLNNYHCRSNGNELFKFFLKSCILCIFYKLSWPLFNLNRAFAPFLRWNEADFLRQLRVWCSPVWSGEALQKIWESW